VILPFGFAEPRTPRLARATPGMAANEFRWENTEKVMSSPEIVTPAAAKRRAGVQDPLKLLDSRLRGNDDSSGGSFNSNLMQVVTSLGHGSQKDHRNN
jgi:hypothetical protein